MGSSIPTPLARANEEVDPDFTTQEGKDTTLVNSSYKSHIPTGIKVKVHFRATGNAPILKRIRFSVNGSHTFSVLTDFLRKQLRFKLTDSLFLYCNSAFSPSPDEIIYDVFQCFQLSGELVVNYCTTDAYG